MGKENIIDGRGTVYVKIPSTADEWTAVGFTSRRGTNKNWATQKHDTRVKWSDFPVLSTVVQTDITIEFEMLENTLENLKTAIGNADLTDGVLTHAGSETPIGLKVVGVTRTIICAYGVPFAPVIRSGRIVSDEVIPMGFRCMDNGTDPPYQEQSN